MQQIPVGVLALFEAIPVPLWMGLQVGERADDYLAFKAGVSASAMGGLMAAASIESCLMRHLAG